MRLEQIIHWIWFVVERMLLRWLSVYFHEEANTSLAKPPMKLDGGLA